MTSSWSSSSPAAPCSTTTWPRPPSAVRGRWRTWPRPSASWPDRKRGGSPVSAWPSTAVTTCAGGPTTACCWTAPDIRGRARPAGGGNDTTTKGREMTITEVPDIALMEGTFYSNDPFPAFAWMRRHEPAYYDEEGQIWGISRYADVRAIGQDPQNFSSAQGSRPHTPLPYMIDMDAPEHRRRRRLVSAGFT